jgi:hypothetical protein
MGPNVFNPTLRYDKLVEKALRGVIVQALQHVIKNGLPEEHHFYITFLTQHPDVQIPDYLHEQYPEEMTIVLQYQFYGLEADEDRMAVTLSFNNIPERLVIPMEAVTIFADPAVNFALQFQPMDEMEDIMDDEDDEMHLPPPSTPAPAKENPLKRTRTSKAKKDGDKDKSEAGNVVSIDTFRKK